MNHNKVALITGITGQDGSYLAEFLNGIDEIGRRRDNGQIVIRIDPGYFRFTEVETLLGDATKSRKKLGWVPQISLEKLIKKMISNDINEAEKEKILKDKGFEIFSPLEGPS